MIRIVQSALLLIGLMVAGTATAELVCVTPYGSCPAQPNAASDAACYCASQNGSAGGHVQPIGAVAGTPAQPLPSICCTQAGRIPFANVSIPIGGECTVPTIRGPATGQACY